MSWYDHTCHECSHWDDINGCWAGQETDGPYECACPHYQGDDWDDDDISFDHPDCDGQEAKGD